MHSYSLTAPWRRWLSLLIAMAVAASIVVLIAPPAQAQTVVYRINAGGSENASVDPLWEEDSLTTPSGYNNVLLTGQNNRNQAPGGTVLTRDPSVPSGVPTDVLLTYRFDPPGGVAGLEWDFPVDDGLYEVRLYFVETDKTADGERLFDVTLDGIVVLDDYDIHADVGHDVAVMKTFATAVSGDDIDIDFGHEVDNPAIAAIEILTIEEPLDVSIVPDPVELSANVDEQTTATVTVANNGGPSVIVESMTISGTNADDFADDYSDGVTILDSSESLDVEVTFNAPASPGSSNASLDVTVNGEVFSADLEGTATFGDLSASPADVDFGNVVVGSNSSLDVTVTNVGDAPASVTGASVGGADAGAFSVDDGDLPTDLAPGGSVVLEVTFGPTEDGSQNAILTVGADVGAITVDLAGTGIASGDAGFTDIAGSTFVTEINWLAATGITRGCNPPVNDRFCPKDFVTRGQMSAFLHRALDDVLTPGDPVEFIDDNGNTFEADIEWLGATGVTRGCNPPTNDRFCPDDPVTREQMAAFLYRALSGE